MLPADCCCCLLPLLFSAVRGCCELLMAGAACFADCGSGGRTAWGACALSWSIPATVLGRLGAVLGRSRAVLERLGCAGSAMRASGTPPEARRPLSSQSLTSTIPYSHARGKIVRLVACMRAVLRAWLIACWLGSFLPDVSARSLARVPHLFACLPTCLLHRLLVRSRPDFAAC